jgi:hypothetical protein
MSFTAVTETHIITAGETSIDVLLTLEAPLGDTEHAKRPPLHLAIAADVSGSMAGDKLACLRETLLFVVDSLGSDDHLSLVKFSSDAAMVFHGALGGPGGAGRAAARAAVRALEAGGGTNIQAGLATAAGALAAGAGGGLGAALLLSDGQDDRGGTALARCEGALAALRQRQAPLHAFGFGGDHDAALLGALSAGAGGGGLFVYVDAPEAVGPAFGATLGALQTTVGRDFVLSVSVPEPAAGVAALAEPDDAAGGGDDPMAGDAGDPCAAAAAAPAAAPADAADAAGGAAILGVRTAYPAFLARNRRSVRVSFGALSAQESRAVLLRLALPALAPLPPAGGPPARARHHALTLSATFSPVGGGAGAPVCAPLAVVVERVGGCGAEAALRDAPRARAVELAALREDAAAAMRGALAAANGGRYAEAGAALDGAIAAVGASAAHAAGDPFAVELAADLHSLRGRVGSHAAMAFGGRAALQCSAGSHSLQRSCGVASPGLASSSRYTTPTQALLAASSPRGGGGGGGGGARRSPPPAPRAPSLRAGGPLRSWGPRSAGASATGDPLPPPPAHSPSLHAAENPHQPARSASYSEPPPTEAAGVKSWRDWLAEKAMGLLGGGGGGGGAPLTPPGGSPPGDAP